MSTNLDTLRRTLGSAAAALVLLCGGASQAVAQHSRSDARPSSGSTAARPSSGDSTSSSSSSRSGSGGTASSTRSGGGSGAPTRIENDSRDHRYRGGGHYGGHYYGGHYGYGGYYGYGPRWGWYGIWNSPWYWGGYGYPYSTSVTVYPNGQYGNLGALDLDLAPERAEVYVDGQRVGVADDFDGFPTYLWLEQGTYDVVFYMPGFKTLARQYSIYPGLIIDVEDTLEPGEAVRPEDLATKTHERRDARVREDREREQQYRERGARPLPAEPRQDWRERHPGAPGAVIEPRQGGGDQSRDVRGEPGTLRLKVEPSDASVYLDGRFIGTAEELSDLRSGLIVDAGTHRLEVVRPGWRSETRSFEAVAGDDVEVEIELDEQ